MSLGEKQKNFIGYLLGMAEDDRDNRGALADLRSGLGRNPGEMARVHKHVVPYLPEHNYDDRWYYLVATLFGAFPQHRKGYSLGAAFRPLKAKSESMEARFIALLNAHSDDLGGHLRHAVSLLRANEQPLDWFRLLEDLSQWDHPAAHVQLKWAKDFYKGEYDGAANKPDTEPTVKQKENHHD